MLRFVYAFPLTWIVILTAAVAAIWGYLQTVVPDRWWRILNLLVAFSSIAAILYVVVFSRNPGQYLVMLRPFATLDAAKLQPELYRELLMNAFLFFPLGLTLSNVLPQKWSRWGRIALTTLCGCLLSVGIEYAQYRFSLGMAETDDVLCNTLGAFLGACSLLIAYGVKRVQKKTK